MPSAIRVIDQAIEVVTDTTNFDGILGVGDTDVQTALETIDEFSADPGGSDKQVQYNNAGAFGGATGFIWQNASPNVTITAQNAAHVPLLVKAAASQSANIHEWQDSSGNVLSGVDERGVLFSNINIGVDNYFAGSNAGNKNASGATDNIGIGEDALQALTSGDRNIAIGTDTLDGVNTGSDNLAIGNRSFQALTNQNDNTGFGTNAGRYNTGSSNVAIGSGALAGAEGQATGSYNVAIGYNTMVASTSGASNIAFGYNTCRYITSGGENMALGGAALFYNITGSRNLAIGVSTLTGSAGVSISNNVALGYSAGYKIQGDNNILVGSYSGYELTTGSSNIFFGYYSGYRQTTNSELLIIDNQQRADVATELTNSIIYGVMAAAPAGQTLRINAAVNFSIGVQNATNIPLGTSTGTTIGTAANQKLGFYGVTPVVQRAKASYNNWAAFTDVVNALVALGLFDAA